MSDQALEKIEKLVNGEIPNGKFQLLRMYGAFERDQERNKIIDAFRERVSNFILDDIIIFSENEAVCTVKRRDNKNIIYYQPVILSNYSNILCDSLDEAIITLVCMRNDCEDSASYMMKLLQ